MTQAWPILQVLTHPISHWRVPRPHTIASSLTCGCSQKQLRGLRPALPDSLSGYKMGTPQLLLLPMLIALERHQVQRYLGPVCSFQRRLSMADLPTLLWAMTARVTGLRQSACALVEKMHSGIQVHSSLVSPRWLPGHVHLMHLIRASKLLVVMQRQKICRLAGAMYPELKEPVKLCGIVGTAQACRQLCRSAGQSWTG